MKTIDNFIIKIINTARTTNNEIRGIFKALTKNPKEITRVHHHLQAFSPVLKSADSKQLSDTLVFAWRGNSNKARVNHPFSPEQIQDIKNVESISVVGVQSHQLAGGFINTPIYKVNVSEPGNSIGFKFYQSGSQIVIVE